MRAVVVVALLGLFCPASAVAQSAPATQTPDAAGAGSGEITRDQFIERAKKRAAARFDRIDTNRDGILSADEQRAARAAPARNRAARSE
jgi:hypothetical protein